MTRDRWGIERVFQQITEVFALRRLIGSTPQATVFQAAFCLLLFDPLVSLMGPPVLPLVTLQIRE